MSVTQRGILPRPILAVCYAAAVLILLDQAAELAASTYPIDVGSLQWRFSTYGLLVSRTTPLVVADILFHLAAVGFGHRTALRLSIAVHMLVGLGLMVGLAGFGLDALELRRAVAPGARRALELVSARAAMVVVFAVGYCTGVTVAGFRATAAMPKAGQGPSDSVLVVRGTGGAGARRDG